MKASPLNPGKSNITDRLAPKHHAAVRRTLKQAWEMDDAEKAERMIRNLARRFQQEAPDVSRSILEGLVMKPSPWSGWGCRWNFAAHWPAPTSSSR